VKGAAPSKESLGATFGLAQSVGCVARAIAPAFVRSALLYSGILIKNTKLFLSSVFAVSKQYNILAGQFVWIVMAALGVLGVWTAFRIEEKTL
jgi:hypothetical protein